MSLDPPAYILALQNNIRARPISWEGAVRAKTITENDLKKIKAIDKVRKEQRKQTIESDLDSYSALLLGSDESPSIFNASSKRSDIVQYMLVLTGDLIDGACAFLLLAWLAWLAWLVCVANDLMRRHSLVCHQAD